MKEQVIYIAKRHQETVNSWCPGISSQKEVTVKNGAVLVSSILTGEFKILTAEDYVNNYCGSLLVSNIVAPHYHDSWAEGRKYDIDKIVSSEPEHFEVNPIATKFTTLIMAIASESIKEGNRDKIYEISASLDDDYIEYTVIDENSIDDDLEVEVSESRINLVSNFCLWG